MSPAIRSLAPIWGHFSRWMSSCHTFRRCRFPCCTEDLCDPAADRVASLVIPVSNPHPSPACLRRDTGGERCPVRSADPVSEGAELSGQALVGSTKCRVQRNDANSILKEYPPLHVRRPGVGRGNGLCSFAHKPLSCNPPCIVVAQARHSGEKGRRWVLPSLVRLLAV